MAPVSFLEYALWAASIAGYPLLIARMYHARLHLVYRFFFLYLAFRLLRSLALRPFSPNSNAYGWIWVFTEPLIWLFYILVVLEIYNLVLARYPGIASFGRRLIFVFLGLSVVIAVLSLSPDISQVAGKLQFLKYYYVIGRGLASSLVFFLLLLLGFLVWYPVPLNRNLMIHSGVYCGYFLTSTLGLFMVNMMGPAVWRNVSTAMVGINALSLLAWIVFLSRKGEENTVVVRHVWQPDEEKRLLEQLSAINGNLVRSLRK